MSKKNHTVEVLERDLKQAKAESDAARKLAMGLQEQYDDLVVMPKIRALVGKCFKYRNNYSCPSGPKDYWWLYIRVQGVDDTNLNIVQCEIDKDGKAHIRNGWESAYDGKLRDGHHLITRAEFDRAMRAAAKRAVEGVPVGKKGGGR